ncbi:tyrosine-type recombinase/integrase [Edaphobacter dinghuensis]|uniref:tyrosine-type recombinase/integrase n=1 Tax=Edaphobacter dinghuensis TaxID=1560005 RepID=UPI001663F54A|nr:site-specific integrase [Edaphobacter dinghuensis]
MSTKQRNKDKARTLEATHRSNLASGRFGLAERKKIPSFKTALADFLSWSEREHRAHPATYRRYVTSSVALLRHFKDASLDKITPDEVERFKSARLSQYGTVRGKDKRTTTNKRIQPATVNRELACLRAMFNHAIKSDVPLRNPIGKTAAKALREDNEQTRVLTYDEQEKYLARATPMLRDVATLMLETGARPEEVYRIEPKNVHLEENYWFNPHGKTKAAKRRIKLTVTAKGILAKRMEDAARRANADATASNSQADGKTEVDRGEFLFPCETDATRPVPKVNNAHDRAVRDSKVTPFRLYDCRHTWATRAVEAGIDLVTLAAMLGHAKINMVLRYAHPTQEHQTKAMDKMELFVSRQKIAHAERMAPQTSFALQ